MRRLGTGEGQWKPLGLSVSLLPDAAFEDLVFLAPVTGDPGSSQV